MARRRFSRKFLALLTTAALPLLGTAHAAQAPRHMEYLDRGTVAVPMTKGNLVTWRILADDADGTTFNLYRDGKKLNAKPIKGVSNYIDADGTTDASYLVKAVVAGKETKASDTATKVWAPGYLTIPLDIPA